MVDHGIRVLNATTKLEAAEQGWPKAGWMAVVKNRSVPRGLQGLGRELGKNRAFLLMLLPAVLYFFLFAYLPMAGIVIAFKSFDFTLGVFRSPWTGLVNFRYFFISGQALIVTRNTVLYNLVFIVVNTILEISVAVFLSELRKKLFKKVAQTVMLMPYFISWVVVAAFIYNIFNYEFGSLNTLLRSLGVKPVNVMSTIAAWKYIIVFFQSWQEVGYGSIIYLAAITALDREMYEAAEIAGATIYKQIRYITIPSLKATVIILVLLKVGYIFRGNFQMFYQIVGNNGTLFNLTDVIDTFVYRSLMYTQEFGMASAVGLLQSVLCFTIIMITNTIIRRVDKDYALF